MLIKFSLSFQQVASLLLLLLLLLFEAGCLLTFPPYGMGADSGRVSFRSDFWDRYWRRAGQLLASFFPIPSTNFSLFNILVVYLTLCVRFSVFFVLVSLT